MPLSSVCSWELALFISKGFGSGALFFVSRIHMFTVERAGETHHGFD